MSTYIARDADLDFAPHPGRILQRELDQRSISQAQLAARTGLSTKHINLVVKGTAPLSPDVAVMLEQILGTSAEIWSRLEASYQTRQARAHKRQGLDAFADWAAGFPRQILIERGVIAKTDSGAELAGKLLDFFGVVSPKAFEKTWLEPQASYKRSQLYAIDANLTALWLRLSERHAADRIDKAPPFDIEKVRLAAQAIPYLTVKPIEEAFRDAQELLLDAGVVLVFVPEVQSTRISGVSRWINGTPLIAVTSRYNSLDGLWFTILHEIAHVLLHPKRSTFVDDGLKADDNADSQEVAANDFAAVHLIPPAFRAALDEATTPADIRAIAAELGVSPSVVAGQWAHRTQIWGGPIGKLRERVNLAAVLP
ncbi:MAG: addiction module antidote protein, HigA family [Microbacterium sp. 67-17]|jgi:HTH-type transcriptional regulator/antitoxin HigA|uniref:HigA family addiction module antitoxin n=1 Tax=Microbacterium sp. 67-17 TaxID=1895782 RepID=UPI0009669A02|nr:HigA family addiction module antitoxin [Microbacterium sp. 67-17]OJV93449.1 MAG: addiction module antidote protein, HigA family [Microbacterium sp. 67-17]